MKKLLVIILVFALLPLSGCSSTEPVQIVATTKPVYDFTTALCQGTDLKVTQLVSEQISCLHDYTLQVNQMRTVESAELIILSGAGLESFLDDVLVNAHCIADSAVSVQLLCGEHQHGEAHHHTHDPHIWLSVDNARQMAENIYSALTARYPQYAAVFQDNLMKLKEKFDALDAYGRDALSHLNSQELITFHDGFSYFADYWGLHILHTVEEESGSEASAAELKELITLVRENSIPAIFVEENGSTSAAYTVASETEIPVYSLSMGMSDMDYFEAMYHNIDTIKEALG